MPDIYDAVGFTLFAAVVVIVTARIAARCAAREWFRKKREYIDSIIDPNERKHNGDTTESPGGASGPAARCGRKAGNA